MKCVYSKQYTKNPSGNDLYTCRACKAEFCPSYLLFGKDLKVCTQGDKDNYQKNKNG